LIQFSTDGRERHVRHAARSEHAGREHHAGVWKEDEGIAGLLTGTEIGKAYLTPPSLMVISLSNVTSGMTSLTSFGSKPRLLKKLARLATSFGCTFSIRRAVSFCATKVAPSALNAALPK
jgi:hypothetical protein